MKVRNSISAVLATVFFGAPLAAERQWTLKDPVPSELRVTDPRLLKPCNIGEALDDLLLPLDVAFGFENQNDCLSGQRAWDFRGPGRKADDQRVSFGGQTIRQALDQITGSLGFDWKQVGEVVVVRPAAFLLTAAHYFRLSTHWSPNTAG